MPSSVVPWSHLSDFRVLGPQRRFVRPIAFPAEGAPTAKQQRRSNGHGADKEDGNTQIDKHTAELLSAWPHGHGTRRKACSLNNTTMERQLVRAVDTETVQLLLTGCGAAGSVCRPRASRPKSSRRGPAQSRWPGSCRSCPCCTPPCTPPRLHTHAHTKA